MASHFTARAHQVLYKIIQNAYLCQKPFNYCWFFVELRAFLFVGIHIYSMHYNILYFILYEPVV